MNDVLVSQMTDLKEQLAHAESAIERASRNAYMELGANLKFIRDNGLYIAHGNDGRCTWEQYCDNRWEMTPQRAGQLIDAYDTTEQLKPKLTLVCEGETTGLVLPLSERHVRPLAKLESADQRAEVWRRVVESTNGNGITAKIVEGEVTRYKAELEKNWITLEQWKELDATDQQRALRRHGNKTFNKQDSDNIEWARWSWNPITGCLHGCDYCYARDIASRFYPQNFAPSIITERLTAPANTTLPNFDQYNDPVDKIGYRNVFTCSMADLFGKWVPTEWIESVLESVRNNPQWTFLFLTKFPIRMAEFDFPSNTWIGTTVDRQWAVDRAEKAFRKIRDNGYEGVAWLSCEPMLEDLNFTALDMFDWVVVGGSSKSTQTQEFKPPFPWIVNLWNQAKQYDLPVYMKTNLGIEQRVREYPHRID